MLVVFLRQKVHYLFIFMLIISCDKKEIEENEKVISKTNFELLTFEKTGVNFANIIQDQPMMNILMYQYYHNGAGLACGDFDNDGLVDLYFVGNFGKNHLYKNLGNFKFEDITVSSKTAGGFGWSTGVCLIDINNDGLLDIYLSKSGEFNVDQRRNELLINKGNMVFEESAAEYGLDDPGYSNQIAFLDYDLDGDLDAYVMNHGLAADPSIDLSNLSKNTDKYSSDRFYENRDGYFYDISKKAGLINNAIGFGLGLSVADFNNDMYPDIYIANDFIEHDYFYLNNGNGTFSDIISTSVKHMSNFSMGNDAADINNDGYLDLFVADMAAEDNYRSKTNMSGMNPDKFWRAVKDGFHYQYMVNTLHLNNGNNTFSEIAQLSGLDKTDWSWAPLFGDYDNDGFKDLFITNGLRKDSRNNDFVKKKEKILKEFQNLGEEEKMQSIKKLLEMMPSQKIPNYIFKNNGDLSFDNKSSEWSFDIPSFSNGAAYADLDNDGDLDIIINNIDDAPFVYKNNSIGNHYINLKFIGPEKNLSGIGTKVLCETKNGIQYAEHYLSRGYLSSVENRMHFGLSDLDIVDRITVIWPDGMKQTLIDIKADQEITLNYSEALESGQISELIKSPKIFKDVTDEVELNYVHKESIHDDYIKQVLLPHEMSKLGPSLSVADVNNDGLEDVFIGAAKGYASALFIQAENGTFVKQSIKDFELNKTHEDIGSVFFDADSDGDLDLYVVCGSSEDGPESSNYQDLLYINDGKGNFIYDKEALPSISISGSCVIPNDFDQDGDLDLFVGGRQIPEMYPSPANSFILVNQGGRFQFLEPNKSTVLKGLGMVTDAEFLDYNEDGLIDILVVGEWMPLTILIQDKSGFNSKYEMPNTLGWWNCIEAGDLDSDGRADYVLGNLGLNVKYHGSVDEPFRVYAKDFDDNGLFDIVLSSTKGKDKFPVRGRQCSSQQIPEIKEKFPNYDLFARATIEDIYSKEDLESALNYNAVHFESSVLFHEGKEDLTLVKLPNHAQISATQDVIIRDFNGDGLVDIMLAGNLEEMEVETPRCDASYGIMLLQDESGFNSQPAEYSLNMSGNVRAIESIKIANNFHILVARNDDALSVIKP